MTNLGGIRTHAMKAQQHDEGGQTRVTRPGYFRICHIDSYASFVLFRLA
jgi:hypothetical protein